MRPTQRHRVCRRGLLALALVAWSAAMWPARGEEPADADPQAQTQPQPQSGGQPAAPAAPLPTGADVAVVRIEGLIYDFTLDSIKRRVKQAIDAGATVIVFELDTPGGVLTSALDICDYIRQDIGKPTIAWVHNEAYSAGALIASACDRIVMSPVAAMGDCAPIVPGQNLAATERAKALTPLLSKFEDNAVDNSYPYVLFHAMCVLGVEVYHVRHKETGEHRLVNQIDYQIMVQGESRANLAEKVKRLFGAGDQAVGVAKQTVATDADRQRWELVRQVHDGSTLLTLSQRQANELGLITAGDIRTVEDLKAHLSANTVIYFDQPWAVAVATFLTLWPVRMVLFILMMIALFIEGQAPGVGVAGGVALVALIGLVVPPFLIGLAEIWHLLLMVAGFVMLILEMFVTPGFGVLGVGGIIAMLVGLVLVMVPSTGQGPVPMPAPEMMGRLQQSIMWTLLATMLSCVAFFLLFRHYGRLPLLNRMVLGGAQPAGAGGPPVEAPEVAAARRGVSGDEVVGGGQVKAGDKGRAATDLRPIGRAEIAGRIVDVESDGGWIEQGAAVRVTACHGNRILVARA